MSLNSVNAIEKKRRQQMLEDAGLEEPLDETVSWEDMQMRKTGGLPISTRLLERHKNIEIS